MNTLSKKSKILIISLMILLLTVTVVSLAIWDGVANKTVTGEMAQYANAKVGDIVTYGNYYQDTNGTIKTPIEWLVVDKDERSGQLTLLAKHVLAGGSYWGNWFYNGENKTGLHSPNVGNGPGNISSNQNWADSTLRAWLNNLERTDVNGDVFALDGYKPYAKKVTPSKVNGMSNGAFTYTYQHSDLLSSVGYSNKNYFTLLRSGAITGTVPAGYYKKVDNDEIYFKRPNNIERPAVNGFLDEAFTQEEQERIVPRVIPGQECHQWPSNSNYSTKKILAPTTIDKIWIPSANELNIKVGKDSDGNYSDDNININWTTGSDSSTSNTFTFFKQFQTVDTLTAAIRATGTDFDRNPKVSNFSIPLDVYESNIGISNTQNDNKYKDFWGDAGTRYYWTRTVTSNWYSYVNYIRTSGAFSYTNTNHANIGARPAMVLSYV